MKPEGHLFSHMPRLSKSRYLGGLQCDKRLYLETHAPNLATPPDEATRAILDMGTEIGVLARSRFPGGVLVEAGYRQTQLALEQTSSLLADPTVPSIFEAAVLACGVLVRVDILERVSGDSAAGSTWRLIEVKSSSRKKDLHLQDIALQTYVLQQAGIGLAGSALMHVNTQYALDSAGVDLAQLFTLHDVTEEIAPRLIELPEQLAGMRGILERPEVPIVEPGAHCHAPHECPFWAHCTKDKPARWIFHLPGQTRTIQGLREQGIETIDGIPQGTKLSRVQELVRANEEWCGAKLPHALRQVRYPVHHLDFETIMPAVPRFHGTRPYQVIPVQWSNHIEYENGTILHQDYLAFGTSDPREELLARLLESLGTEGTICVYSQYERSVLGALADEFPERRADIRAVQKRLWDLFEVIQAHYYHPAFGGSYSIKSVLPAVVPSLSYTDLEIQGGAVAAREYFRMAFEVSDWVEQARIADALRAYCARDTLAMLELRRSLLQKAEGRCT